MKGGNSALGRRLMDVAILVACSHTDHLFFMFFWSVFYHKYVQTKAGTAAVFCSDCSLMPAHRALL